MPLRRGSGKSTIASNIRELHSGEQYARVKKKFGAKKANKQAVAIALSEARKGRRKKNIGEQHTGRYF